MIKSAKGVTKAVIKNKIKHEDYRECASKQEDKHCEMAIIKSNKHDVYTEIVNKKALSHVDNKRILCEDRIHTLADKHVNN